MSRLPSCQHLILRTVALLGSIALLLPFSSSEAQQSRDRQVGGLPREIALEVTRTFNAAATRRVRGDFTMSASDTVRGDLAVLSGTARLGGVVTGQVIVLNGDVLLLEGARIDGPLTILGGSLESPDRPSVGGEIRVWSARYRYHEEADTLVAETDFFARWSQWVRDDDSGGPQSQFFVATTHTYNRVEGLPMILGPRFRVRAEDTRVRAELFGIFRSGDGLRWDKENLGHQALVEVRQGERRGIVVGGRLFDEVDAMERWQLTDAEVGLNTFLFTRDYRDYWQRHGGQGYVALFGGRASEVRATYGRERWSSRRWRDVWSVFSSDVPWRVNPQVDEGVLSLLTLSATFDTRTSPVNPRSGWFLRGEFEHGSGTMDRFAPLTVGARRDPMGMHDGVPGTLNDLRYSRALLDLRRYNRLAPQAQLNMRVVMGGWLSGDPLPVQRRLAVSGLDALPGFDFRRMLGASDAGTCATGPEEAYEALGRPAQCDRIILAQLEWKGDFRINLFGNDDSGDRRWRFNGVRGDGTWVVFVNSGRGWLVDNRRSPAMTGPDVGATHADLLRFKGIPAPGTWRSDIGGGFDFGDFGVYTAQALSPGGLSPNVYLRLSRRF